MKYTYDILNSKGTRIGTTTKFEEIRPADYSNGFSVEITNNLLPGIDHIFIRNEDQYEGWRVGLERAEAWSDGQKISAVMPTHKPWDPLADLILKDIPKDAINPSHYKNFVGDMQWMEAMQYIIGERKGSTAFKAAIEMVLRGYLDRLGGKDPELQELGKALWYLKFWMAYVKNGNRPIKIADIEDILRS